MKSCQKHQMSDLTKQLEAVVERLAKLLHLPHSSHRMKDDIT
jgi:hypothetical protein